MTNNEMLQADVLDLLFLHRNKEYGAYRLRKTYPQRLLAATGLMAFLTAGFLAFLLAQQKENANKNWVDPSGVVLTTVVLPPPLPDVPKPPAAAAPVVPAPSIATTQYTAQIQIVPDLVLEEGAVPPINQLADKAIGTQNEEGALFENNFPDQKSTVFAQNFEASEAETPEIFENSAVDQMAVFPGGEGAFQRYLARQLQGVDALEPGVVKTVKLRFVIEKDGSINNIIVEQSGGSGLDGAVVRVLKKAPRWKPALHRGGTVAVVFNLPVTFVGAEE